jgi:hypothetical protein
MITNPNGLLFPRRIIFYEDVAALLHDCPEDAQP